MNETRLAAGALLKGAAPAERHLVVKEGPDAGRRFPLGAVQTLGRGREADLRLTDPAASRLHLRLTRIEDRIVLDDLRSKNGVRVNGKRCRGSRPLALGDELAIGSSRLSVAPGLLDELAPIAAPSSPSGAEPRRAQGAWRATALLLGAGALGGAATLLLLLP
jgi:pSer/pThr/pTyr-binding forkhead associated (FHA) protein